MVAVATLNNYNQQYQHQQWRQPKRIKSSLDNSVKLGTDAGQASYKRDADSGAEEAFLLHTSWMDWPDGVSQRHNQSTTLIGQQPTINFK